eukprot:s1955_g3.t1
MCSVKAEQAKELNMLVQKSSLQVGVDLEQLEEVLKAPTVVDVGFGGTDGTAGEATSSDQRQGGSVGGSHRNIGGDYEKAPWSETTAQSIIPEATANSREHWFYVNVGNDNTIVCCEHYNGRWDELLPTDFMIIDKNYGKTCVICSANEISSQYHLWPPLNQRSQIIQMAARTKNLINKLGRDGNPVTDPQVDFLQFLKDITNATVGNKLVPFGEALLKALSHFGMVRVPRDRVGQIFQGKRGRQYVVIREEFHMSDCGSRFAYRVSKDYGNVFYKDYLKHVLGRENKSKNTYITAYEGDAVNKILQECAIYKDLDSMCLIEDDEAEIISEIYANSKKERDAEKDDPMGEEGQGEDVGRSAASGAASSSAGVDAEGVKVSEKGPMSKQELYDLVDKAMQAPSAHSMKGEGFKLDSDKIYHPLTTQIANEFQYCYHVTELKLLIDIIEGGLRPGGETGGRTHVFFNPFAPWDDRYKNILGGELTHLGTIRVALVFSVNNLIGFNGMVTASGQIVVGGNVPFSEVEGAWYQNNRYEWIRLLVPAGELQMIRATKEPAEIATRGTVLKIAREVYDDINPEDNIPFYLKVLIPIAPLPVAQATSRNKTVRCCFGLDIKDIYQDLYTVGYKSDHAASSTMSQLLSRCSGELVQSTDSWHSLTNLAWALCRLPTWEGPLGQAVMGQILRRSFDLGLESAPGRDLPVLLWSLAWAQRSGAQLPLSPLTRQPLWEPLLLRLPEVTPQGLAMMLWSFAALESEGLAVPKQTYREVLQQVEQHPMSEFKAREVANMTWSVATVQASMPSWLLEELPERASEFRSMEG